MLPNRSSTSALGDVYGKKQNVLKALSIKLYTFLFVFYPERAYKGPNILAFGKISNLNMEIFHRRSITPRHGVSFLVI
jgi:hypothetical protein